MRKAVYVYPGITLVVDGDTPLHLRIRDDSIEVGYKVLEFDALHAGLGGKIASLLLYPPIEERNGFTELDELKSLYMRRTIRNVFKELATLLERLKGRERIHPLYPLARRSEIVGPPLSNLYEHLSNNPDEYKRVKEFYEKTLEKIDIAEKEGDHYKISNRTSVEQGKHTLTELTQNLQAGIVNQLWPIVAKAFKGKPDRYSGRELHVDNTPLYLRCGTPRELSKNYLGCDNPQCESGHIISSSVVCACSNRKVVVKDYSRMGAKWVIFKIMAKPMIEYRIQPKSRLEAEYVYMSKLGELGNTVIVPLFHEVCISPFYKAMTVREYITGTSLKEIHNKTAWRNTGKTLGTIHGTGITLGDCNPANFLVTGEKTGIIDAEQADTYTTSRGVWDIVTFISTSVFWRLDDELIKSFLRGYLETAPDGKTVLEESVKAYTWIGILPTVPHVYVKSKKIITSILREQ